ncbi:MAG: NAD-dependent deacetylase [Campylobacterales bacterium]|nr:NAD-dependent deacetylase [Campylobacterales bacterium]
MAKVVIFSGSGISAESGISTFRDTGGLWENHKIEDVCLYNSLDKNRDLVLKFYDARRVELAKAKPNKAHFQITKLQKKYPDDIAIITQNVDDLFERAGALQTIHLHGFLTSIKCTICDYKEDIGYTKQNPDKSCPQCGNFLRPDIIFFGESAPMYDLLFHTLSDCEILVVIGSGGAVVNTDGFATYIPYCILNNLEPSTYINTIYYENIIYAKATEAIDEIIRAIEAKL